ncbi:hypothetical protein B0J15DRAFT_533811 [Fusarium solani]|uniref:Uncharacterized protein n=1 Tax=Fusarium solani TaxID=169388 RepID=A0A9P9KU24_FUSSL|nr:uncharacterized protein B0J15DRAFT_533811 [Fusarium solani]KAH7268398.1 hypothetical protein B0J15DRAFT_533811 [Fusarium solani]
MSGQGRESSPQPYGWLSVCLRWPSLLAFSIINIALIATVIALTIVSSQNDGFVTVPSSNTAKDGEVGDIPDTPWSLGILWTSLPSFVFSLFGAYWAWIAGSLAERQPYVELRKEGGADARVSILLDYRVVASIWRWWGAFRKSHYMVGATTLLSVFLTYLVAPFAARLFVSQVVTVSKSLPIVYNQTYTVDGIDSTVDWRPVFDTVSATRLYGGNKIAWTDDERAFRPFDADSNLATGTSMAANTTAYSAYLNSKNNLKDIKVISCATGYRQVAGTLRVLPSTDAPVIQSFVETGEPNTSRPKLWRVFEQDIFGAVTFNPKMKWSTTDLGTLMLYTAQRARPSDPLATDVLMEAIQSVFTAIYVNAVAVHGFETLSEPEKATGSGFVPTTRLFVVTWVAGIIVAFLAITLCTVAVVHFLLRDAPSILSEEPQGLLSMAAILEKSDLLRVASEIRHDVGFDGEIRERAKGQSEVKDRKWRVVKHPETGYWVVRAARNVEMGAAEGLLS